MFTVFGSSFNVVVVVVVFVFVFVAVAAVVAVVDVVNGRQCPASAFFKTHGD